MSGGRHGRERVGDDFLELGREHAEGRAVHIVDRGRGKKQAADHPAEVGGAGDRGGGGGSLGHGEKRLKG